VTLYPTITRPVAFERLTPDGTLSDVSRDVADETPIAIELNGVGYAVLMASAAQLEDLVAGFLFSERIIERANQIQEVDFHWTDRGVIARAFLATECADRVADRVRHRVSDSSCGLCGIENLEQALRPLPRERETCGADTGAMFRALDALGAAQPVNRLTGAVHAAAFCNVKGEVLLSREDVGRHNAFDKLIGAMMRGGHEWDGGFALLSSRCSYELVEKAALSQCPMLVTISAPTALAVERARDANLPLVVLARPDAVLISKTA